MKKNKASHDEDPTMSTRKEWMVLYIFANCPLQKMYGNKTRKGLIQLEGVSVMVTMFACWLAGLLCSTGDGIQGLTSVAELHASDALTALGRQQTEVKLLYSLPLPQPPSFPLHASMSLFLSFLFLLLISLFYALRVFETPASFSSGDPFRMEVYRGTCTLAHQQSSERIP